MAEVKKYLIFVSYVGSAFRGSQIQISKSGVNLFETVQSTLENAFKHICKLKGVRPIIIHLMSRTDTGVHAIRAPIYVNLPSVNGKFFTPINLKKQLDIYFKYSDCVRILEVYLIPDSFRFSTLASNKTYLYRVGLLKSESDENFINIPITELQRTFFTSYFKTFDLEKANTVAQLFVGIKDFGAIATRPSKNINPSVCSISSFHVEEAQPLAPFDLVAQNYKFYHFICKGDRFLQHMVRRMVSLTLSAGSSYISFDDIKKLFDEPYNFTWPKGKVPVVPGCGLYLLNVKFKKIIEKDSKVFVSATDEDDLKHFIELPETVKI